MQMNVTTWACVVVASLASGSSHAHCAADFAQSMLGRSFVDEWTFIEGAYDEREPIKLQEVAKRIDALGQAASTTDPAAPERIAVLIALMELRATLEWIAARHAGTSVGLPAYEYEYRNAHPHRELQRSLVREGLLAHPGDPYLAESMIALQGFAPAFYREQLELALARNPQFAHVRENAVMFHLLSSDFESARPHLVAHLRSGCAASRRDMALEAIAWLHANATRCRRISDSLRGLELALVGRAVPDSADNTSDHPVAVAEISNALIANPDAAVKFLHELTEVLANESCPRASSE